jgi:hypothetical protein
LFRLAAASFSSLRLHTGIYVQPDRGKIPSVCFGDFFAPVPKNVLATKIALRYNILIKAMTENNACSKGQAKERTVTG